ncbi:MAG: DMT family transporter [bacterium]|nr:DMT family transporter [bacterium]
MRSRIILLIIYLSVFGGAIGFLAKISLQAFSPLTTIFLRLIISIAFFAVIFANQQRLIQSLKKMAAHWKGFVLLAFSGIGGAMIVSFIGLQYTTAIHYDLIFNSSSLFILLFAALLLREKIKRLDVALIATALFGVILVIVNGNLSLSILTEGNVFGDALIFVAASAWALYSVLGIKISRKSPELDPTTLTFGSFIFATIFLLPFVVSQKNFGIIPEAINIKTVSAIFTLAIFSTAILFFLWFKFINEKGGVWAALISLSENVGGVIFPILFLSEKLTLYTVIGGLLITAAVIAKELFEKKHEHQPKTA